MDVWSKNNTTTRVLTGSRSWKRLATCALALCHINTNAFCCCYCSRREEEQVSSDTTAAKPLCIFRVNHAISLANDDWANASPCSKHLSYQTSQNYQLHIPGCSILLCSAWHFTTHSNWQFQLTVFMDLILVSSYIQNYAIFTLYCGFS